MYRFTTIAIIIYSALIFAFGLYCFYIEFSCLYTISDSFKTLSFSQIIDQLRSGLNILGFLISSNGIVGIIAGIAIWKKQEGGRRLWLGLISWQMIMFLILLGPCHYYQIGAYFVGETDSLDIETIVEVIMVGSIGILSWFVFCKKRIRKLFIRSKSLVFEIILLLTVISNILCISLVYIYSR